MTQAPTEADLDCLIAELDGPDDAEHPDVSIAHESGWALTAFPSGLVVWENIESDWQCGHRASVDRGHLRRLFGLLASNEVEAVAAFGWDPGLRHVSRGAALSH